MHPPVAGARGRVITTERGKVNPSAVLALTGIGPRRVTMAAGVCVAATVLVATAAAAPSPTARACPSAPVVNTALGTHVRAPVATHYLTYAKICTYPGGVGLTKITFQEDTAKSFAVSEKAAATGIGAKLVKRVTVVGHPGWTTNLGDLYLFDGNQTIKILAPGTATAKLEALAKKLL
jgi:hypothetical protein